MTVGVGKIKTECIAFAKKGERDHGMHSAC
jgi:hypothetical protein